jgi:hypothetical protein
MKNSTHIFICALITLTGCLIDFIADLPKAGWILLGITVIEAVLGLLTLRNERKEQ